MTDDVVRQIDGEAIAETLSVPMERAKPDIVGLAGSSDD